MSKTRTFTTIITMGMDKNGNFRVLSDEELAEQVMHDVMRTQCYYYGVLRDPKVKFNLCPIEAWHGPTRQKAWAR